MIGLLSRLFVRDYQNFGDPAVRLRYGTMVSVVSILCNLLLSAGKFVFGLLLGSIALTADGVNNLSDAGSALVSLVSFRIAAKPADRDHPFGHARIEYVASMIVSFLVLLVGVELLTSSVEKICTPTPPDRSYLNASVVVLSVSILVKLWMGLLNRKIGRKIDSAVMRAAATDSLTDCISTFAVLLSTVLYAIFDWDFLDGWFGLFVAILILIAGCRILNETKNSILGEKPVAETVAAIRRVISEYPQALGIHDLLVHHYGPGHTIASLHVEVDGACDVFDTHDAIDNMERRLQEELGILCTIHADPIVLGDPEVDRLRAATCTAAAAVDARLRVHDFRLVRGTTHSNLIFDIAAPFECTLSDEDIRTHVTTALKALDARYCTVITVDRE